MRKIVLIFLLLFQSCTVIYRIDHNEIKSLKLKIRDELRKRTRLGLPTRPDGFCYAIDLAEIMEAAVKTDDSVLFGQAYEILKKHYIIRDSWVDSAILWRYRPGGIIDASGTAETIHCAYSIFLAYKKWKNEEYKQVSYSLAKAYIKHGFMLDSNRFLVKNYFNYQTRTLSENTWMINQRPDVLKMIGEENSDLDMVNKANMMYNAIIRAYVKNGFFNEMYDPGIVTMFGFSDNYFSPNGMYKVLSGLDVGRSIYVFNRKPLNEMIRWLQNERNDWSSVYKLEPSGKFVPYSHNGQIFYLSLVEVSTILEVLSETGIKVDREFYVFLNNEWFIPKCRATLYQNSPEKDESYYFSLSRATRAIKTILDER